MLPPSGKVSLISIWVESVLYGINFVVYGLCMVVLLRYRGAISNRWMFAFTSTVLFVLGTAHVAASFGQLVAAFTGSSDAGPEYADVYFLTYTSPMRTLQDALFVSLMAVQDFVLIWRLYVVCNSDWKIIVFPILLEMATIATGVASSVIFAHPTQHDARLLSLSLASCSLNLIVNIFVTMAIAARLWWMGKIVSTLRRASDDPPIGNPYASSILVIIESGAIVSGALVVMLALYITETDGGSLALGFINVTSQLAVITPLLIVVKAGLGLNSSLTRTDESTLASHSGISNYDDIRFQRGPVQHAVELRHLHTRLHSFSDPDKVST